MSRFLALLSLCSIPLYADSLDSLRDRLAKLPGSQGVDAQLSLGLISKDSDKSIKDNELPLLQARVHDGAEGLSVLWSREVLTQCEKEALAKNENHEASTPIRDTVDNLHATQVAEYLNAAQSFIRKVDRASIAKEEDTTWEGRPVHLLNLKLNPTLSEKDKKYIKEFDVTAQLWLDPSSGLPLSAKIHVHLKGRAFIVISFEEDANEDYRFAQVGDRLIITELRKDGKGSGGGESNSRKSIVKIDIAKS